MKVCQIYVGHRRTFWHTEKNHKYSLLPINYVHHRNERSSSFVYHTFDTHPYQARVDGNTNVQNVLNSWHNRYVAFVTAPEDYDVYVLMRYDIEISDKIDFTKFSYDDNTIYAPSDNDHAWGVNDQLVFGNREVLKKYVSIHTNHLSMFHSDDDKLYPWFHNESYCTRNLLKQGVTIHRIEASTHIVYDVDDLPDEHKENPGLIKVKRYYERF